MTAEEDCSKPLVYSYKGRICTQNIVCATIYMQVLPFTSFFRLASKTI